MQIMSLEILIGVPHCWSLTQALKVVLAFPVSWDLSTQAINLQ